MRRLVPLAAATALLFPTAGQAQTEGVWLRTYPAIGEAGDGEYAALFPDGAAFVSRSGNLTERELLRSTDHGLTWTPLPSPFGTPFYSHVVMGTSTLGVAISQPKDGLVLMTRDGGTSWAPPALPPSAPDVFLPSNAGISPSGRTVVLTGFFVRDRCANPTGRTAGVYASRNAGLTWTRSQIPARGTVARVEFADDLVGAAVVVPESSCHPAYTGLPRSTVWVTEDGGLRWRRSRECVSICWALGWAPGRRLAVGEWQHGELLVSADRGRTYRRVALLRDAPQGTGSDCACLTGVAFAPDGEGWAFAAGQGIWHAPGPDGPWTLEPSPAVPAYGTGDVAASTGGRALVVGPHAVLTRVPAP